MVEGKTAGEPESVELTEREASLVPASQSRTNSYAVPVDRLSGESLRAVIENYVEYYARGEGHTARAKRYDLEHFLQFLAGDRRRIDFVLVSDWTLQRTKDFIDDRLHLGEAPATVSRRLATLKHFGRTLAERVPGYINPAREVKSPTLHISRPDGLSADGVRYLREGADREIEKSKGSFLSVRNRFMLELLLSTGLRADEIRVLTLAQVNDDVTWLKNVKTKGRRFRNVYLQGDIRELVVDYLEERRLVLLDKFPILLESSQNELKRYPVLISLYGAQPGVPESFSMSPKSIWRVIATFGKLAGGLAPSPLGDLHPHRLRHTFAHGLLDSSKDIRLVAQALGHSDVRTTMRYTERSEEEIASAIEHKASQEKRLQRRP